MKTTLLWLKAARPKTFIISASPILIGSCLALKDGCFSFGIFLCTLLATFCIQIASHYANDYFDFLKGADRNTKKAKLLFLKIVSPQQMLRAMLLTFMLAFLFSLPLIAVGGWPIVYMLSVAILLAITYTAGPFSLSYLGIGDMFAFLFYGPIAVLFTYYLQSQTFSLYPFLCGIGPGALCTLVYLMNNLRDWEEDRKASKKSLVVRFGKTFGKLEFLILFLLLLSLPWLLKPYLVITYLPLIPLCSLIFQNFEQRQSEDFEKDFKKCGLIFVLYTLFFLLGLF